MWSFGFVWRSAVVGATFVGVGLWVSARVAKMSSATAPVAQVRLSSMMAGLFCGGAAAVLVLLAVLMVGRGKRKG